MKQNPTIVQRFREWPRAFQWLTCAIAFIALFLIWDTLIRPAKWAMDSKADKLEQEVQAVRNNDALAEELRRQRDVIINIGRVTPPRSDSEGRDAMTVAFYEVVLDEEYDSVRKYAFDVTSEGRIPDAISREIAGPGRKLARLNGEVNFEASPEDTIRIVRDFEQRPDIESVSEVRIKRIGGRMLEVHLKLEAWVEVEGNPV